MPKNDKQVPGRVAKHVLTVQTPSGKAQLGLLQKGRTFTVEFFSVENRPELSMAFQPYGPGVQNLDETSDVMQVFNRSTCVRVDNVVLGTSEMRANSVEELILALKTVKISTFIPEEI